MSATEVDRPANPEQRTDDWVGRQRQVVSDLVAVATDRHSLETEGEARFEYELNKAKKLASDAEKLLGRDRDVVIHKLQAEYNSLLAANNAAFEKQFNEIKAEFDDVKDRAEYNYKVNVDRAKKRLKDARWEAQAIAESAEQGAKERFHKIRKEVVSSRDRSNAIDAETTLTLRRFQRGFLATSTVSEEPDDKTPDADAADPASDTLPDRPMERVGELLGEAELAAKQLSKLWLPQAARTDILIWPFLILGLALIYPLGTLLGWVVGTFVALGAALAVGVGFGFWFIGVGTAATKQAYSRVTALLNDADKIRRDYYGRENRAHRKEVTEIRRIMSNDVRTAERKYEGEKKAHDEEYEEQRRDIDKKYPAMLAERKIAFEVERDRLNAEYPKRIELAKTDTDSAVNERKQECVRKIAEVKERHAAAFEEMIRRWTKTLRRSSSEIAAVQAACDQHFPNWSDPVWEHWKPAERFPHAIPFGQSKLSLDLIPNGIPKSEKFSIEDAPNAIWPAAFPFPGGSLLLKASGAELAQANETIQAVMLRLLAGLPPSKVKFTIIDPVGLGQNFAAFMHLADYDDSLVHNRIWTEPTHIENALSELTEHMETVIQKYLRNEFESIADYNEQAGEVAEPYRFVVVANFPVGFTESAARRLISIVQSGERCGVQALVSLDTKQPLPHGVNLGDFERKSETIIWSTPKDKPARWVWLDDQFGPLPLQLATPPSNEFATRLLHEVGAKAKEAGRVQVPFEVVAPPPENWWQGNAADGVAVPLGRAGATKLQSLRLGQGTSQHVLIAGRTGSGKSTLLHALVTNLALHYSPDEVEVYLIDFKKGVEFKTYATHKLPHARVIAIESEREFGLSAMQRLDAELKIRGDLYRKLGVQDLAGYRRERAKNKDLPPLPRILLIVDEFQEFFVEDDRVAQEASLLLDRLVRQGRAFGIHVHLGSQTLGGAYSLARSTLGQMAIRIALQCSESDAHLILSEENSAARLLSRPGEAIYNDSNGTVEGNSPFQVVWLPDERREHYLNRLAKFATERGVTPKSPPIVFEGNAPAEITSNRLLTELINSPPATAQKVVKGWLGEAIAIKDPTSADFHAHSGSHLLMIGQQNESSMALFVTAIASIGLQIGKPASTVPAITILNGNPQDAPHADLFDRLAEGTPWIRVAGMRDFAEAIDAVAKELAERTLHTDSEYPPIFLCIFDLARFRSLRKAEDDFSFGMSKREDAPPDPSKQLASIVRDGAAVGIHLVLWCDTLNNLNRVFDRTTLREFDMRVLFQMSGNDSSTLIDTPAASRLGFHRALFVSEEQGRLEKFRPYGVPAVSWIEHVKSRWNSASE